MATGRKKLERGGAKSVDLILLRRRVINGRQFEAGDLLGTVTLADNVTADKLELCCHARQAVVRTSETNDVNRSNAVDKSNVEKTIRQTSSSGDKTNERTDD